MTTLVTTTLPRCLGRVLAEGTPFGLSFRLKDIRKDREVYYNSTPPLISLVVSTQTRSGVAGRAVRKNVHT